MSPPKKTGKRPVNYECKLCGYKTDRKSNLIKHQTDSERIQRKDWCKRSHLLPIVTGQEVVDSVGDNEITYPISPRNIKSEDSIHISDDDDDDDDDDGIDLQTVQSGSDKQTFAEERHTPSVESQQGSGTVNRSTGNLSGECWPDSSSHNEPQKGKKFARTFAKFIESQILEIPANKRHKLTNDIIQVIAKYTDDE